MRGFPARGFSWWGTQAWLGSSKIGAKDNHPSLSTPSRLAAQRDRLGIGFLRRLTSCLKMKRFPPVIFSLLPLLRRNRPLLFFFEEFRQKPLWNRRLLMISSYFAPNFAILPCILPLLFPQTKQKRRYVTGTQVGQQRRSVAMVRIAIRAQGLRIVFGREGRLGNADQMAVIPDWPRTEPTTPSAPSAVSATIQIGRV